jgi:hypothetical protein
VRSRGRTCARCASAPSGSSARWSGVIATSTPALWRRIDEVAAHTTGLAHEVLWLVEADQSRVLQDYAEEGRAIATGLRDVVTVLTQYDAGTSAEFLAALMAVGEGVGRARGPFGQRISQDDRDTLTLVAEILELDLADSDPVGIPR